MASHVLSFVVESGEPDFSAIADDVVTALRADGHNPTEVRWTSDAGEVVKPVEPESTEPDPGGPDIPPPDGSPGEQELPLETPDEDEETL